MAASLPARYRHIAVEGPIGAGKTSLARRLAERLDAELLLERPGENPFLGRFYQDMERYALPTQLFFLFQRISQLRELAQLDMFSAVTVADFLLDKDPLFARLTLTPDELLALPADLRFAQAAGADAGPGDLPAGAGRHADRARPPPRRGLRARTCPRTTSRCSPSSYTRFFYHYADAPVLIVNSERLNFVEGERDLDLLLEHIAGMRGGREFFNRGE